MSFSVRASSNGGQMRVIIDPSPAKMAKALDKSVGTKLKQEIGKQHKALADKPIQEIIKRANAAGRGQVRIGRAVRPSATAAALTIRAGGGAFPDFGGQEYGSLQYRQFPPWSGSGESAGLVIGAVLRDDPWMTKFGEEYQDHIEDLFQKAINSV